MELIIKRRQVNWNGRGGQVQKLIRDNHNKRAAKKQLGRNLLEGEEEMEYIVL